MSPKERQSKILELFSASDSIITPEEIMRHFNISIATVRRDLTQLEKLHLIKKLYGGVAKVSDNTYNSPIDLRLSKNKSRKDNIGKYCASLINEGDCVFLDAGTTVAFIAEHIKKKKNITVITNSLLAANRLADSDLTLITLGGTFYTETYATSGHTTIDTLKNFNTSICFISLSGINLTSGITDYPTTEIDVKRTVMSRSLTKYLVADSSKFDFSAPYYLCDLDAVDAIITDSDLAEDKELQYRKAGGNLILA